ncbi:hypothetical protein V490_04280 [Pseudogymnoascus sp. VKM F-3557]|nr:hypothetical protein V490_04280 [Pseudogymnoascus sp. VKM F-3557]
MHLSSVALLAILASAVNAFPNAPVSRANALMSTVNLYNGVDITTVEVVHSDMTTELLTAKNMCAGSVRCTNDQWFRDQCADAVHKVEDVVYEVGGNAKLTCNNLGVPAACALAIAAFSWKDKAAALQQKNSWKLSIQSAMLITVLPVAMPLSRAPVRDAGSSSTTYPSVDRQKKVLMAQGGCQIIIKLELGFLEKSSLSLSYHQNKFKAGVA